MKRKLGVTLLAIVGVCLLLRLRGKDTKTSEPDEQSKQEAESESKSTETTEESTTSESATSDESTTESATDSQRELDMFDMLAIFAAAITEARDEYRKRTGI